MPAGAQRGLGGEGVGVRRPIQRQDLIEPCGRVIGNGHEAIYEPSLR